MSRISTSRSGCHYAAVSRIGCTASAIAAACAVLASVATNGVGMAHAQELITNGSFAGGLTGWTQDSWEGGSLFGINANGPTSTAAASGDYAYAGGGAFNVLQQNITVTTGSAYRLSFLAGSKSGQASAFGVLSLRQEALTDYNAASFDYRPSDAAFGSYTVDFVADTTTIGVWLRNDAGTYEAYDNVSVTPIASVANAMNYSAASGFSSITSALTGSGKVTSNAGTGGLTLSGANTYTGGTEVTGGTLFVAGAGTLGAASGNVTVTTGGVGEVVLDLRNQQIRTGTIAMVGQDARIISGDVNNPGSIVNNGVAFQFGGGLISVPVSGSAGMNVTGGGVISGSNSYAGPTTISATPGWYGTSTLFVSNANALGSASADLTISGGTVDLNNNTVTRSGNLIISGGRVHTGTLSKSNGVYGIQGGQIEAVLAGAAGLAKSGTGTATLSGVNSYAGGTEVTSGTLVVTGTGTLGAASGNVTVTTGGVGEVVLDLRNQQIRTGTIAMVGQDARIISGDVNNPGSIVNNGVAFQFGGGLISVPVSGSAGMNVTGGGSITGSNSYAGPTTISATPGWYGANALFVSNANALGSASADLTISGGIVGLQANTITRSGNLIISGGLVRDGTFSKPSGVYDVQGGQIDAALAGAAGLTKSGTGSAGLLGSNSYSGATTVNGGELYASHANALGDAAAPITVNGGTLFINANMTRTGTVTVNGADLGSNNGSTLTINGGGLVLTGSYASTGAVLVAGSAGLTSSAADARLWTQATYSGSTTVTAGTLNVSGVGGIPAASPVSIAAGATVNLTGSFAATNINRTIGGLTGSGVLSGAGGTVTVNNSGTDTFGGDIQGGQGLIKDGAGTLALVGNSSYTGTTTVNQGTLAITTGNALGSTTAGTTVANGARLLLSATTGNITVGNEALTISGTGSSGWVLRSATGANTWGGKVTLAADATIQSGSGASLTLDVASGDAVDLGSFTATFNGAGTHLINDPVVGTGGVTKDGSGILTLAGNSTYSGATTVSLGTLSIGSGGTAGSIASDIVNNASLIFNRSDALTYSGSIGGSGGLAKAGDGTLTLTGNSGYAGATAVDAGGLLLNGVHTGVGLVSVASGARIGGDGSLAGGLALAVQAQFIFNPLATLDVAGVVTLDDSFSVGSLVSANGSAIDWGSIADGTYTLINTTSTFNNISNFGAGNAADIGGGRTAYFQNGSLQLVVVPEPSTFVMLGCIAACGGLLLRRRRASVAGQR